MRLLTPALAATALLAAALLPGAGLAAESHGDHGGHGDEGPANPMVKSVILFLDGAGGLAAAPTSAGAVPAAAAMPDGTSAPVLWTATATKNTVLDSSVFVEMYASVTRPTLVAGGPQGAAFLFQLALNGQPVEGAATPVKLDTTLLQPGPLPRMKVFLPQAEVALAPGDSLGLLVSFFGLNPDGQPAVQYDVGGEQGSRMALRLRMASLDEVDLPRNQLGPATLAPAEGFDFQAAAKKDPAVKEFTLKAFQFGFRGAPIVVQNNTRVVLHITVDETLSTANEGHAGHAHGDGAALAWDANAATALHGFSLASLDPALTTVAFDGLVTTLRFTADKPGNYTFICTVFCGSGHGRMLDQLRVEGPLEEQTLGPNGGAGSSNDAPLNQAPGLEALAALAGLGAAAVLAVRRR